MLLTFKLQKVLEFPPLSSCEDLYSRNSDPKSQDNSSTCCVHTCVRSMRGFSIPKTHAEHTRTCSSDLGNVCLRSQADHDVQFLQFDIDGVIVLHKEHFDFLLQDFRPGGNITLYHSGLVQIIGSILTKGTFCLEIYPKIHGETE